MTKFLIDILIIIYLFFCFLKIQYKTIGDKWDILLLFENHYKALLLFIISWYFISEKTGLYKLKKSNFLETIRKVLIQAIIFTFIVFTVSGLKSKYLFNNYITLLYNISIFICISIHHIIADKFQNKKFSRVVFIDTNNNTNNFIKQYFHGEKMYNYGEFVKAPQEKNQFKYDFDKLYSFVKDHNINILFFSLNGELCKEVEDAIIKFSEGKYLIYIIPDISYEFYNNSIISYYGTFPIYIYRRKSNIFNKIFKRLFDVAFSLFFITFVLSWLLPILALIIKFTSKGPIIYKQERIGLNGRPFKIMKFRSMYVDAEYSGPKLATDSDPRITSVGKIMRKYRIDEFPQFINVLKGEMSIVGPRPERKFFIDKIIKLNPNYKKLHKVKPGITSIGQVYFGYAETVEEMSQRLKYDLLYLQNENFFFDIKIIYLTIVVMIQGKGK